MTTPLPPSGSVQGMFNIHAAHSYTEAVEHPPQTSAPEKFTAGEKADVVIIGGGYTGLSAALHLAQLAKEKGTPLNIVLLEAGKVGSAASGKSGGHVGPDFQEHDIAAVKKLFTTQADAEKALALATGGPALVEKIITENKIDADIRKGYVVLSGGEQVPVMDGSLFGIEPYPYVLGMAQAARDLGVKIYEDTPVKDIKKTDAGFTVSTVRGDITAKEMLAAGGHKMAETVPYLHGLRSHTFELKASTIVTDPLPQAVLKQILPSVDGARVPFSTDETDVAYGTVDRHGRIIFGARVGALNTTPQAVAGKLFGLFPKLKEAYKKETGKNIGFKAYVSNEPLSLTINLLPNVGRMGDGHLRYVHGLGGHGIALGTVLGKTAAEDIYGTLTNNPALRENFGLFAAVKHSWMPSWSPLRKSVAYIALETVKTVEKIGRLFKKPGPGH